MSDVIGVAIENWTAEHFDEVTNWLISLYGISNIRTWYVDIQPLCEDLVMRKDIYFLYKAAFGDGQS